MVQHQRSTVVRPSNTATLLNKGRHCGARPVTTLFLLTLRASHHVFVRVFPKVSSPTLRGLRTGHASFLGGSDRSHVISHVIGVDATWAAPIPQATTLNLIFHQHCPKKCNCCRLLQVAAAIAARGRCTLGSTIAAAMARKTPNLHCCSKKKIAAAINCCSNLLQQ